MPDFAPVEPHGAIEEIFPDVFCVRGSVRMGPGMRIPRNMVVLRHEGELTAIDAVRLDDAGEAALAALGEVKHVVKLGFHGMDDPYYVDRYGAALWALPGANHSGGLTTDRELVAGGALPVPWAELFVFQDTQQPECALIVDRAGGVLLTCDSVQHWPDLDGCSLVAKGAMTAMGFKRPANIGPPWRKMMTPEGGTLRGDFERLLAQEFDNVIGGHGKPMIGGAKAGLRATVESVFG